MGQPEFPLGIVADTELRLDRLLNSLAWCKVSQIVLMGGFQRGFGFDCEPPTECLLLPVKGEAELRKLFEDVKLMGAWIRERHKLEVIRM